jgi:hypothetical protein
MLIIFILFPIVLRVSKATPNLPVELQFSDCTLPLDEDIETEWAGYNGQCAAWPETNESTHQQGRDFFWLHYPLTGDSFLTVVVANFCHDIPRHALIRRKIDCQQPNRPVDYFEACFPQQISKCNYFFDSELKRGAHFGDHIPITLFSPANTEYITMLRSPTSLVASGFNRGYHGCLFCSKDTSLAMYASYVRGMYGRMLLGSK